MTSPKLAGTLPAASGLLAVRIAVREDGSCKLRPLVESLTLGCGLWAAAVGAAGGFFRGVASCSRQPSLFEKSMLASHPRRAPHLLCHILDSCRLNAYPNTGFQ